MSDAKRELRSEMRRRRAAIADRPTRSQALWTALFAELEHLGLRDRPHLHVLAFVGVGTEPDTTGLLEALWQMGATVYLPRVLDDEIAAVRCNRGDALQIGAYGIPSPIGEPADPAVIDLVIVPGLAFTRNGQRLGQGGGYYDRYLPGLRADCVTVGVCFHEQIVESVSAEPHDRIMSLVVTDSVAQ